MTTYQEAFTLVESLYQNGDLSTDQASPILETLNNAVALENDYGNLCYLYREAQELRYLLRDVMGAKASKHDEAVQRADRQWVLVRDILAQLALDDLHPGRAGGATPQAISARATPQGDT